MQGTELKALRQGPLANEDDCMTITSQARSFDKAAASYAANRPSYPPALLQALEELANRPLRGRLIWAVR